LGDLDVFSLSDGTMEGSLRSSFVRNATVEDVRAALKQAGESDEILRTPLTAMAIAKGGNLMLVDTGTGGFPSTGRTAATSPGVDQECYLLVGGDPKDGARAGL
jgi:hypothetical protein